MARTRLRFRRLAARCCAGALLASTGALAIAATPTERFRDDPDRLVVATAHWKSRAELQAIAGRFQHVAVDQEARTARVEASREDLMALRRMGVRVDIDFDATDRMRANESAMAGALSGIQGGGMTAPKMIAESSIPGFTCYRTVEETYATMDQLASSRPRLARVVDIGRTWAYAKSGGTQGYRMRALRLTNAATDASLPDKPNMVVLAAIHAREYTTAELVTRFAEWLANGHGTNAEATWLLDNFRFHFILQGNPDGRKKAESGLSWRKNTNTDNGVCSTNAYGVDLNRNFPWRFGTVPGGSSADPCLGNYRGPSAGSEEETRSILRYVVGTRGSDGRFTGGVLPDRRTDTGPAPSNYRGMFLDIHSFSRLVLWPWAYTTTAPPNGAALRTLGRRMAYFNGYRPAQWTALTQADGTTTDTVYGITGAPSYTIELGQEFFEDCETFESTTYPRNFNALRYAARNLQAPYLSAAGPDTTAIARSTTTVQPGGAFAVSAWIDDARFNQSNGTEPVQRIAGANAYVDTPPWGTGAAAIPMRPTDGAFDSSREKVVVNIDTRNLLPGRHVVYVRGIDAAGQAGTPAAVYFTVSGSIPAASVCRTQESSTLTAAQDVAGPLASPVQRPSVLPARHAGAGVASAMR